MAKTAMNPKVPESITSVQINFFTPDLPPPYSYAYSLTAHFSEAALAVDFSLTYTGRDEIEEEEILEEGFTLDDDYELQVSLPKVWAEAFHKQLKKTSWRKSKKNIPLNVTISGLSGSDDFEGAPSDLTSWEYFLQELMQGIFEAGNRERPLEVQYKEIKEGSPGLNIMLQASFQKRTALISFEKDNQPLKKANLEWKDLKKLLKAIFMPDFNAEAAQDQIPSTSGKYINPGDGLWYSFGKAITNPGKEVNSLAILENHLKEALSQ